MKKTTLFLFTLVSLATSAQTINSVTVVPANPTTTDNILILGEGIFNFGSCNQHTQAHSVNGNIISAWALHCLGMATVICTDTDTFAIGLLPAGTYTVTYQLDEGFGGPPCTPGIVPGPTMNASFTVSLPTGIEEEKNQSVVIYPNPVTDGMLIYNGQWEMESVEIFNLSGEKVMNLTPASIHSGKGKTLINASKLTPGIYFVRVTGEKETKLFKIFKQ